MLTYERDVVLDPFMGVGTTGIACAKTNRHFIGIDNDIKYCEIAKNRITAYKSLNGIK
jgi:DNA modification methylase